MDIVTANYKVLFIVREQGRYGKTRKERGLRNMDSSVSLN